MNEGAARKASEDGSDAVWARFGVALQSGAPTSIEQCLEQVDAAERPDLFRRLLLLEWQLARQLGQAPSVDVYLERFPEYREIVVRVYDEFQSSRAVETAASPGSSSSLTQTWREQVSLPGVPSQVPQVAGYEVLEFVARGGMGFVLKARHTTLKRLVALKMPLPERVREPADRERFLREARSSARLQHPNICSIYDVGSIDGQPYLAMAFVSGLPLSKWSRQKKPTARQAAELVAALARAAHYAHEHGVVHRDIKPANVLMDEESGQPILTDFGLAKDVSDNEVQLTVTGQVMGTPAYMAPEQAAGRLDQIGPCTDIYALGAVLYELITGHLPFEGTVGEVISMVQSETPPAPRKHAPKLHRDLETICLKAMSKEPAMRYASAAALAEDLERFCAGESILARREPLSRAVLRKIRRNPSMTAAGVLLLVALTAVAMAVVRMQQNRQLAELTQQLTSALDGSQWSADEQQQIQSLVQEIERLDPATAQTARARVHRQMAQFINQSIHQELLDADKVAQIEAAIEQLAKQDNAAAQSLRASLATRLGSWANVITLEAPFDTLKPVFPYDDIAVLEDQIRRNKPTESPTWAYDTLPSETPSSGMVEIDAEFADQSWRNARWLGVGLNVEGERGYFLVLSTSDDLTAEKPPEVRTFADVQQNAAGDEFQLSLIRNRQTIRVDSVSIPPGPLRLHLRREGDRLTWQINGGSSVSYRDIFPLSGEAPGVFGLVWPEDIGLVRLTAAQQSLAQTASALERGDFLFDSARYEEALAKYREQMLLSESEQIRQEARLKVGLCLLRLERTDQAITELEAVAAAPGDRYPVVAASHLWLTYLQRGRADLADVVFDSLAVRQRLENLTQLVPAEIRVQIYDYYRSQVGAAQLLEYNPQLVQHLERAVAVADAVMPPYAADARNGLLRAYHAAGDLSSAMRVAQQLLDQHLAVIETRATEPFQHQFMVVALLEEMGWIACQNQTTDEALQAVERVLGVRGGTRPDFLRPALVERARLRAHRGEWDAAQRDLDEFFRTTPPGEVPYRFYASACLLQGFLHERTGDHQAAQDSWKRGLFRDWPHQPGDTPAGEARFPGGGFYGVLNDLMLASLTGEMTDEEAQKMLAQMIQQAASTSWGGIFQRTFTLPPAALREMFRNPRGKEAARQFALHQVSHPQHMRQLASCLGTSVFCQTAFGGNWSADDEQLGWDLMDLLYDNTVESRGLSTAHLLQLAMSWKGVTNAFGWGGVAPSLEPPVRGHIAYMLGHRYRRIGQPDDARQMFQTALTDAPADSLLARRAAEELQQP